jgi:hypothetical protein
MVVWQTGNMLFGGVIGANYFVKVKDDEARGSYPDTEI